MTELTRVRACVKVRGVTQEIFRCYTRQEGVSVGY
jgi:hypothetical protein